jgi:hypothetical protein
MSEHKFPLKYSDPEGKGYCDALMPSECRRGADCKGLFKCATGEIVRVEWLGVFRNERGESQEHLEWISQCLYGWTFERVQSHWIARLGKVEGFWDKIRMREVE